MVPTDQHELTCEGVIAVVVGDKSRRFTPFSFAMLFLPFFRLVCQRRLP